MLALLALVVLVHQPIWLLTQYLIARGAAAGDRPRCWSLAAMANVVLSVVLAYDGRHLGCRAGDAA